MTLWVTDAPVAVSRLHFRNIGGIWRRCNFPGAPHREANPLVWEAATAIMILMTIVPSMEIYVPQPQPL
jgi:hypothetical protein